MMSTTLWARTARLLSAGALASSCAIMLPAPASATNGSVPVATQNQGHPEASGRPVGMENLRLWTGVWSKAASTTSHPDGSVSTDNGGYTAIQISGDGFGFGDVWISLNTNTGKVVWSRVVQAYAHDGHPAGSFGWDTPVPACAGRANGFARAYDGANKRWSAKVPVRLGCVTL